MILAFVLTMPSVNTWNGSWSGQDSLFAIVRNLGRSQKADKHVQNLGLKPNYSYDFGDGWRAKISVGEVDAREAREIRNKSKGFCGYDWMVDSLLMDGTIQTKSQRLARKE